MKVLVTGASGQVGSRIVKLLLERDHEVRGTVLPEDTEEQLHSWFLPLISCRNKLRNLDIELFHGNLTDPEFVSKSVNDVDAVIHTANVVGSNNDFDNNVKVNSEIAKACARKSKELTRFVYISSSAVYPNDPEEISPIYHPIDEEHPTRPTNEYGLSKLIGELVIDMYKRKTGLKSVILRPTLILSESLIFTLKIFTVSHVIQLLQKGLLNVNSDLYAENLEKYICGIERNAICDDQPCDVKGYNGMSWDFQPTDANDAAYGAILALTNENAIGETFNIATASPMKFSEGAQILSKLTNKEILTVTLPVTWHYGLNISKAIKMIGFQPRGNLVDMLNSLKSIDK